MRDVSFKPNTLRTAKAVAILTTSKATIDAIKLGNVPKADPLVVAKVAGIQAAKNTSVLIPYCHQVPLDFVSVDITLEKSSIVVSTEVKAVWKTGVEMEALVAASITALTLYDMLKIIDEKMEILSVKLLEKKGGKSSMAINGQGLTAAVLVLSDSVSRKKRQDLSGKVATEKLIENNIAVLLYETLPDNRKLIEKRLKELADKEKIDLIVTTGGTGVGPRDVTPEATLAVVERRMQGVEEAMRSYGQDRTPTAMLSRGVVGVRGTSVIVNLPGARNGVADGLQVILPSILHSFRMMKGEGHGELTNEKFPKGMPSAKNEKSKFKSKR